MVASKLFQKPILLPVLLCAALSSNAQTIQPPDEVTLWFNHPAANWNEALPVGNGRLGAMIFGNATSERLQLNEQTVWTGAPEDFVNPAAKTALPQVRKLLFAGEYAAAQQLAQEKLMGDKKMESSYQTLGDLRLDFTTDGSDISEYRRELNLQTAIAKVSYRAGAVLFTREVFSSAPDQVLVVRLAADKAGAISFSMQLSRPGNKAIVRVSGNEIIMQEHTGNGTGVRLAARLKLLHKGGTVAIKDQSLQVEKADTVTLLVTVATNYRGDDEATLSRNQLDAAAMNYEDLKKRHIADYQAYFNRVDFNVGKTDAVYFPTDTRLTAVQNGNTDPDLIKLYYQFGRYLLISSSRPGGLPANLQGIWADGLTPPWSADYHININIQMNYWPAEVTNLSELHLPFLAFLKDLIKDGKKTANNMYGMQGAVAHFTTDAWHFTETYGRPQWAMWPMGLAWSAQHIWEHYRFTGDKNFLDSSYHVLKEAALFCADWLVKNPTTGYLVSGPSISPENTFKTGNGETATMMMGPTMDHMIIRELFQNTIAAAAVLQKNKTFTKRLQQLLQQLAPTKPGSDGRILEWTEAFEESEPGHRHISHLFGLHPGKEITPQTPQLMAAARKTIDYRLQHGGGHTGWSRAWIINFFARLGDGEAAYKNLIALLQKSTLPNLFDNHPPFQIDGNFGAVAGITEMLLQSHTDVIQLLPALPRAWQTGYIHGLVARGGFEINIDWERGQLKHLKLLSKLGNDCTIRYGEKTVQLKTAQGKAYFFDGDLRQLE